MERITSVNQLSKGDRIVRIADNEIITMEFVCIHPHNEDYSVMLNVNLDGAPKFWNQNLEYQEWYRYTSGDQWIELHQMIAEQMRKQMEWHQNRAEELKQKIK